MSNLTAGRVFSAILEDPDLPPDTLAARDALSQALQGDDVPAQERADAELKQLKLRDIAFYESGRWAHEEAAE